MAVVAALELDDLFAPGRAARETDGRHRRLGARIDHAQHFDRRNQARDLLGHAHFHRAWRAERQTRARGLDHGGAHLRMVVACNHRSPRADVVDVALAFDIPQVGAVRVIGEERLATDRLERAHRRVDAAGHQRLCTLEPIVIGDHFLDLKEENFATDYTDEHGSGKDVFYSALSVLICVIRGQNSFLYFSAAAATSSAPNTPDTTARKSAPASISGGALSGVMPPIATSGRPSGLASRSSSSVARRAFGLVGDGKNAPNAR